MADAPLPGSFSNPCVVHNPMRFHGGAERYAGELAAVLDAPLYTNRDESEFEYGVDVRTFADEGWLDRALFRLPTHRLTSVIEYENFRVPDEHDAVITSGEVAKGVIQRSHQHRYHVVHSPLRWAYDRAPGLYDDDPALLKWSKRALQSYVRIHEQAALPRIDDLIAVSEVVEERVDAYFGRETVATIPPPVDVSRYGPSGREGFLLAVGRLEPQKRVAEIVETLDGTAHRLKIAGTGSLEEDLRRRAPRNVEVLGFVSERRKRELLARCDALVFNGVEEDFGIVPIEALASGKPVVGVDEGNTSSQIEPGTNGVLFQSRSELLGAIERMYEREWDPDEIMRTAERYDVESFREQWRTLVAGTP